MTRDPLQPNPEEPADRPDSSRRSQAARILDRALPRFVADSPRTPTIIAGDLNSLSHHDWSAANRNLSGHHGMTVPWSVTKAFERAGFQDTFRVANPDVGKAPGGTRLPRAQSFAAAYRIDYIWVRGTVEVCDSWLIDERAAAHGPGLFYSDHAALVTDVMFAPAEIP